MAPRVVLPESRLRARRRKRRLLAVGGAVLSLVLLCGGVVWLSYASFMRVERVVVSGNKTLASSTVVAIVEKELVGTYGYVFPRNNIFIYPKAEIRAAITERFPVLKQADIHAIDFKSIEVVLVEREPRALWCGGVGAPEPCVFMDDTGVVYAPAPEFSAPVYVSYYGAANGTRLPKQFLTPATFEALSAFVDAVSQREGLGVLGVSVGENGDTELVLEGDFTLKFSTEDDSGDVFERYVLARTAEPFVGKELSEFLYVDLRFGDKLYYKLKSEE